jgi:glutamine synthetase
MHRLEKKLSDAQINKYLKRIVLFSSGLKGTSLHMTKEIKLLSLIV